VAVSLVSVGVVAQSVPEIAFESNAGVLNLPSYGEVAGVATNSKGQVFVYARTGHAVATLGDERTFDYCLICSAQNPKRISATNHSLLASARLGIHS
jgi:hypothetical protein